MVFEYETDKSIFIRYSEQSKLNANAAAWTGASTFLQALAIIIGLCCAK